MAPRGITIVCFALACCVAAISTSTIAATASSRVLSAVNELRAQGCAGRPRVTTPLRANRDLDSVAERMSDGAALRVAVADGKYRASRSASIHVSRVVSDGAVARVLREQFCAEATDPSFQEIGLARRGQDTWIVLAMPFVPPAEKDAVAISLRVLELVNDARAKPRRCGNDTFAAVPPLRLRLALERAAHVHAMDMAAHGHMSHAGSDGSTPAQRVKRARYDWRAVAENVAVGQATPEAAVDSWLESPSHCANLMSAKYTEMGVAYVVNLERPEGIFWAQVFAAPLHESG